MTQWEIKFVIALSVTVVALCVGYVIL